MSTADGATVFVIGTNADGNRQVVCIDDAVEYTLDADAIVEYSAATAAFPYSES